ncbi:fla1 flagellin [Roseburia sp. CAG:100]|nr:fla1 flagellin [Roseburia sp. CAG:100]
MVVQHNLQAMNSNRMLGITQGTLSGSTEKLSSGYKINRAADDAAGLSISEKMRKQIRGLDQASSNAEDGISSVQTAEGALQEVTDMLQRMNELAVQAANGTNSTTDRQYIQDEIDQLVTEVDRVSETTKFNETYLLKGDSSKATTKTYTANYAVTYAKNTGTNTGASKAGANSTGVANKVNYTGNANVYMVNVTSVSKSNASTPITSDVISNGDDITKYLANTTEAKNGALSGANLDSNYAMFKNVDASKLEIDNATAATGTKLNYKDGKLTAEHAAYILDTKTNSIFKIAAGEDLSDYMDVSDNEKKVSMKDQYRLLDQVKLSATATGKTADTDTTADANTLGADIGATNDVDVTKELKLGESIKKLYDADGKEVSGIALNKYFDENGKYKGGLFSDSQATTAVVSDDTQGATADTKISSYITKSYGEVAGDLSFSLHVGADSARTNKIETNIQAMSAAALGIDKLSSNSVGIVDETGDNATDAIDVIADALQKVSTQRSALGAVQNRLEHTIKNLDNIVENTTSAESAIRDTDMATEMVKYSNANILSQAGQSMLAQANQSNKGVLSLLG